LVNRLVDSNMLDTLLSTLQSRHGAIEIGVLLGALAISWLIARVLHRRLPGNLVPGLAKIGAGSVHRIVWPLLLLVLVWMARLALIKLQPTVLLNIAIPLIAAFAGIRLAVYLLRHMMTPSALLKASERFIVLGVWLIFALYMTGALTEISAALEDVAFTLGKQKVTLLQIVLAIVSVAITLFLALGISSLVESRVMKVDTVDMSSRVVISKVVRTLALVLAILIALPLVGIDLTVLSVFGGALGVGLGFGLQKIASNYVSGFIILLDRSIRLGDLVTVDNKHGVVASIKSRYTVIKALDGTEAIVPNDTLITNTVVNHSYTDPNVSIKTAVTIAYDADLDSASQILLAAAVAEPRVLATPVPVVMVKALGERGIELELVVWIQDADQGQAALRSAILTTVWREFRKAGVTIPTPLA
jgi:small-conductance mechanosensitive channel